LVTLAAREFPGDGAPERNVADELGLALRYGSFAEAVAARSSAWPMVFFALVVLHWGPILACFAVGLVAGRREWFTDLDAHASRWRRWAFGGLLLGVPTQALVVGRVEWRAETAPDAEGERLAATALGVVLAPILSAGYVGLLALWSRRGSRFLAWIEPAGRMSLSVYVGQSVLLSLFYCGYGAGFYERLAPAAVFLTAAASWAILVVASRYWLRRFARGPLETIVAACTHGRASRA
jgi:uncharacterized protein